MPPPWVWRHVGVPHWYTDLDDMLSGSEFELMVNLTPMQMHGVNSLKAVRAHRHVWSEKPLASSLSEADGLLEEASRRGVGVYAAPNTILSPAFAEAARVLASGQIGRVYAARGRYGGGTSSEWSFKAGGGALFNMGVYNVTTLTGLLGPAKGVVALTAIAIPRRAFRGREVAVEADDNTTVLVDFGEGVASS